MPDLTQPVSLNFIFATIAVILVISAIAVVFIKQKKSD